MNVQKRMSPITAFFLGIFSVIAIGIASGTLITLYGMYVIDAKASSVLGLAKGTITGLPDLLDSLPPAVSDVLNDRRAPEYAAQLEIDVHLITDERSGGVRPVLTVTNTGDEVVSMLAVRVAALNADSVPLRDWTQVVATPLAIEDDWRGPLFPHGQRHVVLPGFLSRRLIGEVQRLSTVSEISELRLWEPEQETLKVAGTLD